MKSVDPKSFQVLCRQGRLARRLRYWLKNSIKWGNRMIHCYKSILGAFILFCAAPVFAKDTPLPSIQALAPEMFTTQGMQTKTYQEKLLAKHPVIVALFSPSGGQLILYRPNHKPLIAPALPQAQDYELASIIEHTAMATYAMAIYGMNNPSASPSWKNQMQSYQVKIEAADSHVDDLPIPIAEKKLFHDILRITNHFIITNIKYNALSEQETASYAKNLKPYFVELSQIVISDEVNHWMQVVADWKQLLGNEWNNTYGVVMYIDTRPQNNILLGILAHYMDSNAIGKQLFYFTANTYSPTAAEAIQLLAKATPDKVLAEEVYGEYYLSYSQILGQRARAAMKFYQTPNVID